MRRHKIIVVAGARPNFMKTAPLLKALSKAPQFQPVFVHTGQHYDFKMSDVFFRDLSMPHADVHLNVGSGPHGAQTAKIMTAFEEVLAKEDPSLVIVVGDVNSTLACALAASKRQVPVAHVEAGLRSFDRDMPEEVNRIATDRISDYLFVTEKSGIENLKREGFEKKKVFFAGNVMIDTLLAHKNAVARSSILKKHALSPRAYAAVTLHRPSNVDSKNALQNIALILESISRRTALVFPMHPRTLAQIKKHGLEARFRKIPGLKIIDPLGYVDFVRLVKDSLFVLTDSGGIQEEATVLNVPCLTMRENTERPSTIRQGTNELVGRDRSKILRAVEKIVKGKWKKASVPALWDGRASERIVRCLKTLIPRSSPAAKR